MSRLSIVVPTHERETRLAFALDSIAAAQPDGEKLDVIVVRSPDPVGPLVDAPAGLDVRFLGERGRWPGVQA